MSAKKKGDKDKQESVQAIRLAVEITKLVIVPNRNTAVKGFDYVGRIHFPFAYLS